MKRAPKKEYKHAYGSDWIKITRTDPFGNETTTYKPNMAQYERRPGESLDQQMKRLGKQADTSLKRIHKLSQEPEFKYADKMAAATLEHFKTMHGVKNFEVGRRSIGKEIDPEGKLSKQELEKAVEREMRERIAAIKDYLSMPSSSKKGIKLIYKQKAILLNKQYGTNYSWQEWQKIFQTNKFKDSLRDYGSNQVFETIAARKKDLDAKAIADENEKHEYTDDIQKSILKRMRGRGIKVDKMLKQ